MKKSLIALAALAAVSAASAQSTVTLSGGVSMGLQKYSKTTEATQVSSVAGVDTINSNSFIFTAVEDLGGGLKATAVIQQRLAATNQDAESGDLYVDLAGAFGSVRAGKWTWNSNSGYNAFASRTVTSVGTASQQFDGNAGVAAATTTANFTAKNNNILSYSTPTISGFSATVAMIPDGAAAGVGKDATGLKVNYVNGPLDVVFAQTKAVTLTATADQARTNALSAKYNFGMAIAYVNMFTSQTGAVKSSGNSVSVAVPLGAATLKAGKLNNNGAAYNIATVLPLDRTSVGVDYSLSKRSTLIAELATDKDAFTGLNKRTNYFVGVAHTF